MKTRRLYTAGQLEQAIQKGLVLVDFSAPWSGTCHAQEPILAQLAERFSPRATIALLNIDDNPETARQLGIEKIPTLALFRNGREIMRYVGVQPIETLTQAILQNLKKE